jgi:hypothetical protein
MRWDLGKGKGQDAIDKAQQLRPDLIFLDLAIPKAHALRADCPIHFERLFLIRSRRSGLWYRRRISKSAGMSGLMPSARGLLFAALRDGRLAFPRRQKVTAL